ncbi:alpha/beta fold hydrolase [Chromobacterium sp. IIBBL 290-4]|uniref:alpha/beta fold hydrolase n=1 Tax=Chromobacterium sp. IIBBL 290-4 TaxID=2953890 RepID=UPI0020B7F5FB|nr:alpha/beta hydrolase [Chromobacterium sp. IIBBL 290-4]UTH75767.1 lysophospholipase [Chromobacterium sp. IIBBL 290-4]
MQRTTLTADDGQAIPLCQWLPETPPRAVALISHGMSEYAARYHRFAQALAAAGYAVYAHDHRGHGDSPAPRGFFAAKDGWNKVVDDVETVRRHAAAEHPGLPIALLGHSMGSFIARAYFLRYGGQLAGLALSSTGYRQRPLARLLGALARFLGRLQGWDKPSRLMAALVFGSFNLGFPPWRTGMDWLSRDAAEVDAYIADPDCGFDPTPGLWVDLFRGIIAMEDDEADGGGVNRQCKMLLFAGSRDPVSLGKLALGQLEIRYRDAGVLDLRSLVYPGGRHEMLNETNRAQVESDILAWLARVAPAA